jgi:hypothetical protein
MTRDMMVGDDVSVFGDDGAAADALIFDFATFAKVGGHDADAHEGGPDLGDGGIHLEAERGGNLSCLRTADP